MHNMAIALKNRGYKVTGSDDAIYDPAKSNLERAGLDVSVGWDANVITNDIDAIIVGMHARSDNPELTRAKELGLDIMSFPEFVASESHEKKRVVIAGSHGKTTTTAMIMYVLSQLNVDFDYLVGSSIEGFDLSVKLTDAPLIIIEGDEYLSSPLDLRSKFLWYKPHVSIITGIAYDHINVFPTFDLYVDTFDQYIKSHAENGKYFWFAKDEHLQKLSGSNDTAQASYDTPVFINQTDGSKIVSNGKEYPVSIVGKHNLENLRAAELVCNELGIDSDSFYKAAGSFTGAGRRMEKIVHTSNQVVYRDFAHSPSKLKATTEAIAETYEGRLLAVFELHTFSSLTEEFLPLYRDSMDAADTAVVFYNSAVFKHKKMKELDANYVQNCFKNVQVLHTTESLQDLVNSSFKRGDNILLMSSGKFDGSKFDFD